MSETQTHAAVDAASTLPPAGKLRVVHKNRKYDFSSLEVGDTLQVPKNRAASLSAVASVYKRHNPGWNYTTRWAKGGDAWMRELVRTA